MQIPEFTFNANHKLIFGAGTFNKLPGIIKSQGQRVVLITGSKSFRNSIHWTKLLSELKKTAIDHGEEIIDGEPSPEMINRIIRNQNNKKNDVVVAIGGGSVIDAGKAVSAMIPLNGRVEDYLEGVGRKKHSGVKIPFIAVPTTAGTGSEATKNAVLSRVGSEGFKKSLRHDNFVPDIALIDPDLTRSCPPEITSACGLDAFTQLLESYTSSKASVLTDALSFSGMSIMGGNLIKAYQNGEDRKARSAVAYGSYISGLTLANAGLGVVHGLASVIGGWFKIPHGVVCGTLLASAVEINIEYLKINNDPSALKKYARIGALLSGKDDTDIQTNTSRLIDILKKWESDLKMPMLSRFGIDHTTAEKIAAEAGLKNNPARLSKEQIKRIILNRID